MKLVVDKASLVSVADAIREKGNTAESLEFPNGFVGGINAIESGGGGTEEIEQIIDQSGVLDSTEGTATEKVERVVHIAEVLKASKKLYFANTNITHIDFYIDGVDFIDFANTKKLEYIEGFDLTKVENVRYCFEYSSIKSIHQPLNFSNTTAYYSSNMFEGATNLEHILIFKETIKESLRFGTCSKLSAESIQSIIDGLATVETAQTLTLHKDVKAKLTETQLATITGKNWNLA